MPGQPVRRFRAWLLVGMTIAALAACTSDPTVAVTGGPTPPPMPASVTATTTHAPATSESTTDPPPADDGVPADLLPFYDQHLEWGSCAPFAPGGADKYPYDSPDLTCTHLAVPLDYDIPDGPRVSVAVMRLRATGQPSARIGSLVINPGGPGGSGIAYLAYLYQEHQASYVGSRLDLVAFDPRGVGSSRPLIRCRTDAELDVERATPMRDHTATAFAAASVRVRTNAEHCLTRTQPPPGVEAATFLQHMGTHEVIRDIDVLRGVLGDRQLTYLGWSYGTQLGANYAETFPDRVRAMVLDSPINPAEDAYTSTLSWENGVQQAFTDFVVWCQTQSNCPLGIDRTKALARYQEHLRALLAKPLSLPDGRTLSARDLMDGTAQALAGGEFAWPYLVDAINGLENRDGTSAMALADSYWERSDTGHYSGFMDANEVLWCLDTPALGAAGERKLAKEMARTERFDDQSTFASGLPQFCDYLPIVTTTLPHTPHPVGLVTPLVIATTHDPYTPYVEGVAMAKDLEGRLLTVVATRHGSYLSGQMCVDPIVNAYLLNLTLPKLGARCG